MQTLIANFVSGMTTRPTESDRTEALILDATGAEIAQHGFAKVSMESIAKRAGVNRATIYRRFTDRDGLLAAWAHREGIQMTGHLVAAVTGRLDTPERIRAGFVAAADFVRQNPVVRALARDNPAASPNTCHGTTETTNSTSLRRRRTRSRHRSMTSLRSIL